MNTRRLHLDFTEDAIAAAVRKRKRKRIYTPLIILLLVTSSLWLTKHQPSSEPISFQKNSPALVAPTPLGQMEIIESDEELLALLAELGPVLAQREDGTKTLILTAGQ